MARVTKADLESKIEKLLQRLTEQNNINLNLFKEIADMQEKADNSFDNSPTYRQMEKQIKYQETIIKGHEISIKAKDVTIKKNRDTIQELLKEIEELKSINSVQKYNERNAGRKPSITAELKARVVMLHSQGKGYRAIAKDCNISLGSVSKIINEQI